MFSNFQCSFSEDGNSFTCKKKKPSVEAFTQQIENQVDKSTENIENFACDYNTPDPVCRGGRYLHRGRYSSWCKAC